MVRMEEEIVIAGVQIPQANWEQTPESVPWSAPWSVRQLTTRLSNLEEQLELTSKPPWLTTGPSLSCLGLEFDLATLTIRY